MGVAEEAYGRVLVSETGGGREFVEHVSPPLRSVERGVDDRETGDHSDVLEFPPPLAIIFGFDQLSEARFLDALAKRLELHLLALSYQFHAAIRQIANGAGDLIAARNRFNGVAKSDTLHMTFV